MAIFWLDNFLKLIIIGNLFLYLELAWIFFEINFFPVPNSPDINNLEFWFAIIGIFFDVWFIKEDLPINGIGGDKIVLKFTFSDNKTELSIALFARIINYIP